MNEMTLFLIVLSTNTIVTMIRLCSIIASSGFVLNRILMTTNEVLKIERYPIRTFFARTNLKGLARRKPISEIVSINKHAIAAPLTR